MTHVNPLFNLIETVFFCIMGTDLKLLNLDLLGTVIQKEILQACLSSTVKLKSNNFKIMFNRRYNSYFDAF